MKFNTSHITNAMIIEKVKSFIGKIEQRPPIFSALKQDGERLYKRARRGEAVKIKCREVYVERFDILEINMPKILFKVTCGKGTYIRSIAHDLGKKLNSGAYLSALSRVSIGRYNLEQAIEVCDFDKFLNS